MASLRCSPSTVQSKIIVLLLTLASLISTSVLADPHAAFQPTFSGTQMQFRYPCSVGSQQVQKIGTLTNQGDQALEVYAVKILGPDAPHFSTTLSSDSGSFTPFTLRPDDTEGQSIEIECFPQILRGNLSATLLIETNDRTRPRIEIPFSAKVEARPNLILRKVVGKVAVKKGRKPSLILAITVMNNSPTSTRQNITVRSSVGTIPRKQVDAAIKGGLMAGKEKTLSVTIDKLPKSVRRWRLGTPFVSGESFFGEILIDPSRKILEGGETPQGRTINGEFEDNRASFVLSSR